MYVEVSFCQFCDYFRSADRNENFSYDAKRVIFDYIEDYENDTGEKWELDIVSLCCEYNESTFSEVASAYGVDISECDDDNAIADTVREYLSGETTVLGETESTIVFQNF